MNMNETKESKICYSISERERIKQNKTKYFQVSICLMFEMAFCFVYAARSIFTVQLEIFESRNKESIHM